ncbi:MAG: hypothetical protein E6788_05560, partial [Propionibacterium sp.]|nr:hypothetical protein [Propionibacterium sp.]
MPDVSVVCDSPVRPDHRFGPLPSDRRWLVASRPSSSRRAGNNPAMLRSSSPPRPRRQAPFLHQLH